jgi:hypothetical protein
LAKSTDKSNISLQICAALAPFSRLDGAELRGKPEIQSAISPAALRALRVFFWSFLPRFKCCGAGALLSLAEPLAAHL